MLVTKLNKFSNFGTDRIGDEKRHLITSFITIAGIQLICMPIGMVNKASNQITSCLLKGSIKR